MKAIPLFGQGIVSTRRVVTCQRRLNCYYEVRSDNEKASIAVIGTPGLLLRFNISTLLNKPLRAFFGTKDNLYAVAHDQFYSLASDGTALFSGTIGTASGQAEVIENGSDVVVVDGSRGYLFRAGALSAIGGGFPNGARTVTSVSGFFIAENPGTQQFFVSNFRDGSTWDALAFDYASQYTDNIVAVDNLGGNLIPFSDQHFEVWQNQGLSPQPFAPIIGTASEYGLAAIYSRAHVADSLIYLASTRQGTVQFRRIQGYTPVKISNGDIDDIINRFDVVDDAVGMSYQRGEHPFYQCTFPTENRSFLFDCSTNMWSETQTGVSATYQRHRGNLSTFYAGKTLISDYLNGNVYDIDDDTYTDNGETIPRQVITRHLSRDFNEFSVDELYLDMQVGAGLTSGQGSNPLITLECSKNNGQTWDQYREASLGVLGDYTRRVMFNRFGSGRDMAFRITQTDPVPFVIAGSGAKSRLREQ